MDCLFCGEPIEDGDTVIDGQEGDAVVREDEPEWTGEMEYGSQFHTVHHECFTKAERNYDDIEEEHPRIFDEELHECPDCGEGVTVVDNTFTGGSIDRVIKCRDDECGFSAIETFTHSTTLEQEA